MLMISCNLDIFSFAGKQNCNNVVIKALTLQIVVKPHRIVEVTHTHLIWHLIGRFEAKMLKGRGVSSSCAPLWLITWHVVAGVGMLSVFVSVNLMQNSTSLLYCKAQNDPFGGLVPLLFSVSSFYGLWWSATFLSAGNLSACVFVWV